VGGQKSRDNQRFQAEVRNLNLNSSFKAPHPNPLPALRGEGIGRIIF